jgi:hypothetical protein
MKLKLLLVLFLSLLARLFYFTYEQAIWWDAAVYLSMAKFLVSGGTLGLWEPIRPLVWPVLLSLSHLIQINDLYWGYTLTTLFSLGCIYLTYRIAKICFGTRVGILSSFLLSFTWIFFYFNVRLYTEIPSLFFALIGIYFYLKKNDVLSGVFLAIAFLTKFPQGIVFGVIFILLLRYWERCLKTTLAFIAACIPFFTFNYLYYGDILGHLRFASTIVQHAGIWIFAQPWWFYLSELFWQNWLFLLAFPGLFFAVKRKNLFLPLLATMFLLYFSAMPHKEIRFAILFLPYLAILATLAYSKIFYSRVFFIGLVTVFFLFNVHVDPYYENPFFSQIEYVEGEVLVTHPLTAYYTGTLSTAMYYPWFNSSQAVYWKNYIEEEGPEYVSIDTCQGGFLCPPDDLTCNTKRDELLLFLELNYNNYYFSKNSYIIYKIADL